MVKETHFEKYKCTKSPIVFYARTHLQNSFKNKYILYNLNNLMNSRTHNSSLTNFAGRTVTQDIRSWILTAEAWGSNLRVIHVELLVQNRTNLDFPTSITIVPAFVKIK